MFVSLSQFPDGAVEAQNATVHHVHGMALQAGLSS